MYTEKDVDVLSTVEGIRRRPSMYIGHTDGHGLFNILKELIDNAIDEHLANRCNYIAINISKSRIWVGDNGKGIPTGIHPKSKISTLTTVFTQTHAGAKFGSKAYDHSIGVHGVGIKATNALSKSLDVATKYKNKWHSQSFEEGKPITKVLEHKNFPKQGFPENPLSKKANGTIVTYIPDLSVFNKGSKLDLATVWDWCSMSCYLNPDLVIDLHTYDPEFCATLHYEHGLRDYCINKNEHLGVKETGFFQFHNNATDCALSFTKVSDADMDWFTNTSWNESGGTHSTAFWKSLFDALQTFVSKEHYFELRDIKYNLTGVLNVKLNQPKFSSQTKEKLTDSRGKDFVQELTEALCKYFKKNTKLVATLLDNASDEYNNRTSRMFSKKLARKLKAEQKTLLPDKLAAAPNCKPEDRELYIVEGESAAGFAIPARTETWRQEVLSMKGKPLNVARSEKEKISSNKEVFSIFAALGYNPTLSDPMSKLRVKNKIVLFADPDPDGQHINALLLTMLAVVLPQVLEREMVYEVIAPEYMTTYKGKNYYGQTKKELRQQLPNVKYSIQHIKGWGEVSTKVIRDVAFDTKTRRLAHIQKPTRAEIRKVISLMSDDIEARKSLLGI